MLDYAVLGLGFNLVQPSGGWPKELAAVAGSLFDSAPPPRCPRGTGGSVFERVLGAVPHRPARQLAG